MAFPTLSAAPKSCPEEPIDDTISNESEAGYVMTRPRFTRVRHKFGPVEYILTKADLDLLVAHDASVKGSTIFTWVSPTTGTTHNVRFSKDGRVKFTQVVDTRPTVRLYTVNFSLEEV